MNTATEIGAKRGALLLLILSLGPAMSHASDGQTQAHGTLFYTDDVDVFSATRRLSPDGDPTQPALDSRLTAKGSDAVFEPMLDIDKSFANDWGVNAVDVRAQGFVYSGRSRYTHGTVRLQSRQDFKQGTVLLFRYFFAPDLFLGENFVRTPSDPREPPGDGRSDEPAVPIELAAERVTSHIGALRLDQPLTDAVQLRLLGRYGTRRYNEKFQQRDLNFWTLGPHVEWRIAQPLKMTLGYHYERGIAAGRSRPLLADDVSYVNHYASTELEAELGERLTLTAALHFERNDWLSTLEGDERNGAFETVWQGEVQLGYRMNEQARLYRTIQNSSRSESFERQSVPNTNVGLGIEIRI